MDITRAKEIVRILADGINPETGELLPEDSVYHSPEVIRALFTILEAVPSPSGKSSLQNAGNPWTDTEEDQLLDEFQSNMKISAIAKEHGRSRGAIESRLERMGLKKR